MAAVTYQDISNSLQQLYRDDPRPWLVGFSGGKDSTLVAALVFDAVLSIPPEQRTKPITVLCTGTRNGRSSHKRAQRNRGTENFSLSASTGERVGVRCRDPRSCTVVERDKASEGLLANGDERMEQLIEFRETPLHYQDPTNGKREKESAVVLAA